VRATASAAVGTAPGGADDEHSEAVSRFGLAFKMATRAVRRLRGQESHRPGELSYAQCALLFGIADGGECSASELAGLAGVAPATATQMLDHLATAGFVERVRSERDRRIVLVSLTSRGSEEVAVRRERYAALWTAELATFSIEELAVATAVLERAEAVFVQIAAEREGA